MPTPRRKTWNRPGGGLVIATPLLCLSSYSCNARPVNSSAVVSTVHSGYRPLVTSMSSMWELSAFATRERGRMHLLECIIYHFPNEMLTRRLIGSQSTMLQLTTPSPPPPQPSSSLVTLRCSISSPCLFVQRAASNPRQDSSLKLIVKLKHFP